MADIDNQQVKSKRDAVSERLRSRYPDKEFADDEAMFGQISDDYDDYDNQLSGYRDREQKLSTMFTSDPRSAYFLTQWRDGGDPVVELVRNFGTDIKEAIDDPSRLEEIATANKEFVERVAKERELEEQYQANLSESLSMLSEYQRSHGLTDEEVDAAMQWLEQIVGDGIMGKFSAESVDMAMKAINHDSDVATAESEGEVRGKNAKIDERLRTASESDGTIALNGSNNAPKSAPRSIFDVAREAQ